MKILFVCKANVFRSPIATGLLNLKLEQNIAESAGIRRPIEKKLHKDKNLHKTIIKFAKKSGIDLIKHKPRVVTDRQVNNSDYIFVFDRQSEKLLKSRYPRASKKIFLLKQFLGYKNAEIADFRGASGKSHINYIKECAKLTNKLIKKLEL